MSRDRDEPLGSPVGTLGFDLDMTLIDTSAAMRHGYGEIARKMAADLDVDACVRALGSPVREVLGRWLPAGQVDEAAGILARAFAAGGLSLVRALPGARPLLARLRGDGTRILVATTRRARSARASLSWCRLPHDELVAGLPPAAKATVLRGHGCVGYVGDHPLDMAAAHRAGVPGIGVLTGFHSEADLVGAGASLVLPGLDSFPAAWPFPGARSHRAGGPP